MELLVFLYFFDAARRHAAVVCVQALMLKPTSLVLKQACIGPTLLLFYFYLFGCLMFVVCLISHK